MTIPAPLEVKRWDASQLAELEEFCEAAHRAGIPNNGSIDAMSMNKVDTALFCVYNGDRIAGLSYAHQVTPISDKTYRVGTRTCVLPEFRQFKLHFRRGSLAQAIGITAYTIKQQWDHCIENGADEIIWTTNLEGDVHSMKMTRYLKQFEHLNSHLYEYIRDDILYNTPQVLWRLKTGDILC